MRTWVVPEGANFPKKVTAGGSLAGVFRGAWVGARAWVKEALGDVAVV